jgi:hypothetical protein
VNEIAVKPQSPSEAAEMKALARELAGAYQGRVHRYKYEQGLSTEEAVAKADEPLSLNERFRIMDRPPEEATWEDLQALVGNTGERSMGRWEDIKQAAREELRSGGRAGGVLLGQHSQPFQLARFLAIREELTEGCQPRNGVERQLVDMMAQAQAAMYYWQERLSFDASLADPEAAEQAGAMVERFSKMFLRTLRALQDLRKVPLAVVVQNAAQVNVGAQQLNVAVGNVHE